MKNVRLGLLLGLVVCPAIVGAQATMKELDLADGYSTDNTITTAVFDPASAPSLEIGTIEAGYDRGEKIVRRGGGGFFSRGPEYKLNEQIDLATMLTESLRTEATAMGFRPPGVGAKQWHIGGVVTDIYLESRQVVMGATLFYGFMTLELQVRNGAAEAQPVSLRLHNYYGSYNAGMGRQDEAKQGLMRLLVEGAQETLSQLNRSYFHASPHSGLDEQLATLEAASLNDLHRIGLSGSRSASAAILALLPATSDDGRRAVLIDAVGRLGASEAVSVLSARYRDEEDEDCRWYTIKALDYIGGEEALAVIGDLGVDDDHDATERLAKRILDS